MYTCSTYLPYRKNSIRKQKPDNLQHTVHIEGGYTLSPLDPFNCTLIYDYSCNVIRNSRRNNINIYKNVLFVYNNTLKSKNNIRTFYISILLIYQTTTKLFLYSILLVFHTFYIICIQSKRGMENVWIYIQSTNILYTLQGRKNNIETTDRFFVLSILLKGLKKHFKLKTNIE